MWDVLGIAPTTDGTIIRRAYAAKLRAIGGDRDPVAFVRLRKAYEAALAWRKPIADPAVAHFAADEVVDANDSFTLEAPVERPADDGLADLSIQSHVRTSPVPAGDDDPTLADFERAIAAKSTVEASRCLDRLMARGVIGIGEERSPISQLAELALHDLDLPAETFAKLVGHLGLVGDTRGDDDASQLRQKISERLAAEAWLAALYTKAAERAWGRAREEVRIGRALVGTGRNWRLAGFKSGQLEKTIKEFQLYRSWIGHCVDLDRIAAIETRLQRAVRRRSRRQKIYVVFFWLFVASIFFNLIVVLITGGAKHN